MATILVFRPAAVVGSQKSRAPKQATAEIVIFPGVRYERWSDSERPAGAGAPTERDVLKLVE
ncbi:MAG: hypothetical protein JSS20_07110 [Proteobacteria bacterium]|nr:hypothetical protein [Pseudomonadota bacterium]